MASAGLPARKRNQTVSVLLFAGLFPGTDIKISALIGHMLLVRSFSFVSTTSLNSAFESWFEFKRPLGRLLNSDSKLTRPRVANLATSQLCDL